MNSGSAALISTKRSAVTADACVPGGSWCRGREPACMLMFAAGVAEDAAPLRSGRPSWSSARRVGVGLARHLLAAAQTLVVW